MPTMHTFFRKQWLVVGLVGDTATRGVADALEEHETRSFDDLYDATSNESGENTGNPR